MEWGDTTFHEFFYARKVRAMRAKVRAFRVIMRA